MIDDHAGAVGLALTALGGVAWLVGIPPETVSTLVFVVAFISWPIWSLVQDRRHRPAGSRATGFQALRDAAIQVVVVAVLLGIGWVLVQGVLAGPQPGDIICELFDPRTGDCVVESVYEGP